MEEGSLRCDVNLSLSPAGSGQWGTRTETKNVNSLRSVERAMRSEVERQAAVLDAGGTVVQETRHFHENTGQTTPGRSKEEAQDYRYFPEPDLVPLAPDTAWVDEIRASLPELPAARRARLQAEWGLSDLDMTAVRNAGALDLVAATGIPARLRRAPVVAGSCPTANEVWHRATVLVSQPGPVAELVSSGQLVDKRPRGWTACAGQTATDGWSPAASRGQRRGALGAAVIAANPDSRTSPGRRVNNRGAGRRGGRGGRPTRPESIG
jgi:aspartyl-tRNA(Asn)/glutamyl-tRNA(Gln) amidotransferase subunit B